MKNMNKLKISSFVLLITGIILVGFGLFSPNSIFNQKVNTNKSGSNIDVSKGYTDVPSEYLERTYKITISDYCSCVTFYSNKKFSEYDCDSEPTSMPFSGENYDRYGFNPNDNTMVFNGKGSQSVKAKVLEFTKDKLKLQVLGSKQDTGCAVNKKDIYEYYLDEYSADGNTIKTNLEELIKNKVILELWDETGRQNCTSKKVERCKAAKIISNDKLISQIKASNSYYMYYFRGEKGNIESVSVNKKD